MDEIKVGEWVRTVDGHIYIIDKEKKNLEIIEFMNVGGNKKIVKHSQNIIDLIEVGDYVNGERISNTDRINNTIFLEWDNGNKYSTDIVNDKFIISIVTKEQFSSVEYRLEEGDK